MTNDANQNLEHVVSATIAQWRAMLLFSAPKWDTRYYLRSVYVERRPEYTRLISTDGHTMAILTMKVSHQTSNFSAILSAEDLDYVVRRQVVPPAKQRDTDLILKLDAERWSVLGEDTTYYKNIPANFPDWRRVIALPESENQQAQFDVQLLDRFVKARKLLVNPKKEHLGHIHLESNGDSAALVGIGIPEFCGIIMPCRNTGLPNGMVELALA